MNSKVKKRKGGRQLRREIANLLKSCDWGQCVKELALLPKEQVISSLFPLLASADEKIKWHAVTAMGLFVARLADEDLEQARVVMRRMMWNLSDESGGIGWGAPEAMGEMMACHETLADEFAHVLVSFIREDGNFLEYELLQRGVLWGLDRLAETKPDLLRSLDAHTYVLPYLQSGDAVVRGLAVRLVGLLDTQEARPLLEQLAKDTTEISLYIQRRHVSSRVSDLAQATLADQLGTLING